MVYWRELKARMEDHFRFNKAEWLGLLGTVIITAFIFTFRDWGQDTFDLLQGLRNLILVSFIVAISFLFRLACQKIYALSNGYQAEFKVWWVGSIIALVLAFLTSGRIPLILIGGMSVAFMVRQRLGQFRYGFSYFHNGAISAWGIIGNLIMAILFTIGVLFFPADSLAYYLFHKGLIINIIMAICMLLPLPQLDGLNIFFGSRFMYLGIILATILAAVLLLSRTVLGWIIAIILGLIAGGIYLLISSEK